MNNTRYMRLINYVFLSHYHNGLIILWQIKNESIIYY